MAWSCRPSSSAGRDAASAHLRSKKCTWLFQNPAAMAPGAFTTYSYKLDGDTLWVTFEKDQNGPIVNPVTVKAVRVE